MINVFSNNSGYKTHWTTPIEAKNEMERLIGIINLEEIGKGVLVAFRKKYKI